MGRTRRTRHAPLATPLPRAWLVAYGLLWFYWITGGILAFLVLPGKHHAAPLQAVPRWVQGYAVACLVTMVVGAWVLVARHMRWQPHTTLLFLSGTLMAVMIVASQVLRPVH